MGSADGASADEVQHVLEAGTAWRAYLSIDYHIERIEEPGLITVVRSESQLTAGVNCAYKRAAVADALAAAGSPVAADPDHHR